MECITLIRALNMTTAFKYVWLGVTIGCLIAVYKLDPSKGAIPFFICAILSGAASMIAWATEGSDD